MKWKRSHCWLAVIGSIAGASVLSATLAAADDSTWTPINKPETAPTAAPAPNAVMPIPLKPAAANRLTRDAAMRYALEHNPQLALFREQRNMAAAGVVLARIYPYNPVYQSAVLGDNGPLAAGVTNRVFNEQVATLQLELFGQARQRRAAASAAVTRTEYDIAAQEIITAVGVLRAYETVTYREQKLKLLEEGVRLNEQVVRQGKRLADAGRLGAADVLFAGTELDAARALIGQGQTALAVARAELQRQLGTLDDQFAVGDDPPPPLPAMEPRALVDTALKLRPELNARTAAIEEAQARLRLQVADRFGNPALGPRYERNETSVNFVGVVVTADIPILNLRQGEIALRQADVSRARAELRLAEFTVSQSVDAALKRLAAAQKWAGHYTTEVLPNLTKAQRDIERLFAQNEQGVDVLRVVGVQQTLLRASDAYLDAQFEATQARLDLAAAIGEPALATCASAPDLLKKEESLAPGSPFAPRKE